jgi:hypothetical protein
LDDARKVNTLLQKIIDEHEEYNDFITPDDLEPENEGQENSMTSQLLFFLYFIPDYFSLTTWSLKTKGKKTVCHLNYFVFFILFLIISHLLLFFIFIIPDDLEPENEGQENSMPSQLLFFLYFYYS